MHRFELIRVACGVPKIKLGDCHYNAKAMIDLGEEALKEEAEVLVFPELGITGYSCGDLFFQKSLQNNAKKGLKIILNWSQNNALFLVIGMPLALDGTLYNCGVAVQKGKILGIVPKTYIPNEQEFCEKRWFTTGENLIQKETRVCGQQVPIGTDILFQHEKLENFVLGIEICEDLWSPIPPSTYSALAGATVIANLSASNEIIGRSEYRLDLVRMESGRCNTAYLYTSAGFGESTGDLVFGGHALICERGNRVKELPKYHLGNKMIVADIDLEAIIHDRQVQHSFRDIKGSIQNKAFRKIIFDTQDTLTYQEEVNPYPFVPTKDQCRSERCKEIFNIQTLGLASRLDHLEKAPMVIGISGGLDSTMALLVCVNVCDRFNLPRSQIHAVTMPGFGTTDRTYENATALIKGLGASFHEISIVEACIRHFKDIGQDEKNHDITYENAQARERTQILMDLSNKIGGIVIGTGDLSELALGWATYNGDHMSMYNVNGGVPKTLMRYLVQWVAKHFQEENIQKILYDVLDTPVSPELLPPDENGKIRQKTEEVVGPYSLHDFFTFHMVRNAFTPEKIYFLAKEAFKESYEKTIILNWLKHFYRRFFSQQFKRSCLPDGPKIGSVSFSPRGDWRMPSDAKVTQWLEALEQIEI